MLHSTNELLEALWVAALRETWEVARRDSPYYREALPDVPKSDIGLEHLRSLPVMTKADVSANNRSIYGDRSLPASMLFTGGSTGGPAIVYRTVEEIRAHELSLSRELAGVGGPLVLITTGGAQGTTPLPYGAHNLICVPLHNWGGYEWAWRMLTESHSFRNCPSRITHAVLPLHAVKKFVHFIRERNLDPVDLALQSVCTSQYYLSTGWRKKIEDTLRASVVDCFGFTEAPGARAFQCNVCGYYHFGDKAIWEYVDPCSTEPVTGGLARLLVTTLYPYSQGLILFRYDPADLVEVGPVCELAGSAGFKPKGKRRHAVEVCRDGRTLFPLLASDVQETIDTHHWVARSVSRLDTGVTATEDDGFPKWRAVSTEGEDGVLGIDVEVELNSSPCLFADEWSALAEHWRTQLLGANATLSDLFSTGRATFSVTGLPPGGIPERAITRC